MPQSVKSTAQRMNAIKKLNKASNKAHKNTAIESKKIAKKQNLAGEDKNLKKIGEFKNILCTFCGEMYTEQNENPLEGWIECNVCQ